MTDIEVLANALETKYKILSKFYVSNFFTPTGSKDLYEWLIANYKQVYEPDERLVIIQDHSDVYEYDDLPGSFVVTLQKFLAKIDISNCFVTIVTHNKNIESELTKCNALFCKSIDNINFVVVPGEYAVYEDSHNSDTFCMAPWVHLFVGTDGNVLPCCTGVVDYPLGNVNASSIADIIQGSKANALRKNMLSGKRSKECASCYFKEDNNLPSLREKINKEFGNAIVSFNKDGTLDDINFLSLDIRLNKICNLKCRSCGPYYSSSIAQEFEKIYNIKDISLSGNQRKQTMPDILSHLHNIKSIYFGGGEPLIMPEHYEILNELIRIGNTDLSILYNTNFTTFKFKDLNILELWDNFSDIEVGASLDAYGKTAEYWRHGTVWSEIEDNLKLINKNPNIKLTIVSTVGITNVESLIELQKEWHSTGKLNINNFSIRQIIQNSPTSIQVLPAHHKIRLQKIIQNHIDWCNKHLAKDLAKEWLDVYTFMLASDESYLLPQFKQQTLLLDKHRKECFTDIFPQYADLLI